MDWLIVQGSRPRYERDEQQGGSREEVLGGD